MSGEEVFLHFYSTHKKQLIYNGQGSLGRVHEPVKNRPWSPFSSATLGTRNLANATFFISDAPSAIFCHCGKRLEPSIATLKCFLNHTLTFMFASEMALLGFFLSPMPWPGIELTRVELHLFLRDLNSGRFTNLKLTGFSIIEETKGQMKLIFMKFH